MHLVNKWGLKPMMFAHTGGGSCGSVAGNMPGTGTCEGVGKGEKV